MAQTDQQKWDERYGSQRPAAEPSLPEHFRAFTKRLTRADTAIDVACGDGRASVWLALQGVQVTGFDISPVAIAQAEALAATHGVSERCTFVVADFDEGLPDGPLVDLILCNMFRSTRLDGPMMNRLEKKGTLAIAALSEVGAEPGRYRVKAGALVDAFSRLKLLGHGEGDGIAWLVARNRKQRRQGSPSETTAVGDRAPEVVAGAVMARGAVDLGSIGPG